MAKSGLLLFRLQPDWKLGFYFGSYSRENGFRCPGLARCLLSAKDAMNSESTMTIARGVSFIELMMMPS